MADESPVVARDGEIREVLLNLCALPSVCCELSGVRGGVGVVGGGHDGLAYSVTVGVEAAVEKRAEVGVATEVDGRLRRAKRQAEGC